MSVVRVCTIMMLAVSLCAADLLAQGLGAVAARTAEERKASERSDVTTFSDKDLRQPALFETALRDFLLTEELFWKYVRARARLLDLRAMSPKIDQDLLRAERAGADPLTIEAMMVEERQILTYLDLELITPRAYTLTEVSYHRALADASVSDSELSRLPPTRAANARWVRTNDITIKSGLSSLWADKQRWLDFYRGRR